MSHKNSIRKDKTCLNCNYVVENRFCPNCGQENIETRKTFHHLFIHFFEDLTHYENAFWKTIKNLLLRPASLTSEYLSGKRMSYLAPVRLYIFISFITFFIISFLPKEEKDTDSKTNKTEKVNKKKMKVGLVNMSYDEKEIDDKDLSAQSLKIKQLYKEGKLTKKEADTLINYSEQSFAKNNENFFFGNKKYSSIKELDSLQKVDSKKLNKFQYWITRKLIKVTRNKEPDELKDKFLEAFQHNIPKALFIYMPIFAFLLWLFHSKKRWFYFDHGIFTLHYFSFLLAVVLIYNILDAIFYYINNDLFKAASDIISLIIMIWSIVYFYKAHKRFYGETKTMSFIKSTVLFILNLILMFIVVLGLVVYSFINIH